MKRICAATLSITISAFLIATAHSEPINIDFGTVSPAPSNAFGAASGQVGTWNNVTTLDAPVGLVDTGGAATGALITVVAGTASGFDFVTEGAPDYRVLMDDNFFSRFGAPWSFTVSGLANGLYDIYLYEPHNRNVGTGSGNVNGVTFRNINAGAFGTFLAGSNYHLLDNVAVVGGLLTGTWAQLGEFSGLAGLQIIPNAALAVSEPGLLALLGAALGAFGLSRRRKKA